MNKTPAEVAVGTPLLENLLVEHYQKELAKTSPSDDPTGIRYKFFAKELELLGIDRDYMNYDAGTEALPREINEEV